MVLGTQTVNGLRTYPPYVSLTVDEVGVVYNFSIGSV